MGNVYEINDKYEYADTVYVSILTFCMENMKY